MKINYLFLVLSLIFSSCSKKKSEEDVNSSASSPSGNDQQVFGGNANPINTRLPSFALVGRPTLLLNRLSELASQGLYLRYVEQVNGQKLTLSDIPITGEVKNTKLSAVCRTLFLTLDQQHISRNAVQSSQALASAIGRLPVAPIRSASDEGLLLTRVDWNEQANGLEFLVQATIAGTPSIQFFANESTLGSIPETAKVADFPHISQGIFEACYCTQNNSTFPGCN